GFHPLYNLEPFKSIKTMFTIGMKYNGPETMHLHISTIYINLLGNVLVFMPVGFISPFLQKEPRWYKSLLAGLALSMTIEITQLFIARRSFDVDDLLLNGLGTLLGYGAFKLFTLIPPFKRLANKTGSSDRPHGWQWAVVLILSIVGWALAIFLQQYRGILKLPLG
ncbi:MAG: VanZ family protein, partial [Chloroflexi bacterium]|nr:VanZ family protein [Chloroflexota bacterium]